MPEWGYDDLGFLAVLNTLFTAGLLVWLVVLAMCSGLKTGCWLGFHQLSAMERLVFATALGLGMISYSVTFLSIAGMLNVWSIGVVLLTWGAWSGDVFGEIIKLFRGVFFGSGRPPQAALKAVQKMMILAIFLFALLQALTPPWSYDALMYHLQGPQKFLAAGGFVPLPDIWQANGPLTVDMLYAIGLAFETDAFARLVHLSFGILFVAATYCLAKMISGPRKGWNVIILLMGIPILPIWFSLAYQDAGWALFELLSLYALLLWREKGEKKWVWVSGMMMGFAIGSKYLALGSVAVLGGYILWLRRKTGWEALKRVFLFGAVTAAVGAVWYLKNWFLLGNPVYPIRFGGPGWGAERLYLYNQYHLLGFGTGRSLLDYLLLPVHLYTQSERFSSFLGSIEIPGFLFPLTLFYPMVRDKKPLVVELSVLAFARFVIWAAGSQQVRFMLPLFPLLAVISAEVLFSISRRLRAPFGSVVPDGLLSGLLLVTLVYQGIFFFQTRPLNVLVGRETKGKFLTRVGSNYASIRFLLENLAVSSRVLVIQDGRGYYCDARCLIDTDHSGWTLLTMRSPDLETLQRTLEQQGITHLLLSISDADFMLQHDPTGDHYRALQTFEQFRQACLRELYRDREAILYEIRCQPE